MHKQGEVVVYVEAGVESNALVLSSRQQGDVEYLGLVVLAVPDKVLPNLSAVGHGFLVRTVFSVPELAGPGTSGWKEFASTPDATVRALHDTINQMDAQLSQCSRGALGTDGDGAKPGDHCYSAAYQDVIDLHAKYVEHLKHSAANLYATQPPPRTSVVLDEFDGSFDPSKGDCQIFLGKLPSAADLDAVAKERAVAEKTSGAPVNPEAPVVPSCTCTAPSPVPALNGEACGVCGGDVPAKEIETKEYANGTKATGVAPLPERSPEEQAAVEQAALQQNASETHPV